MRPCLLRYRSEYTGGEKPGDNDLILRQFKRDPRGKPYSGLVNVRFQTDGSLGIITKIIR